MNIKRTSRIIGKVILWILGIWVGLLLILQIVLLPPIFTNIANSLADSYLDADVSIGNAYGSIFMHFPRITFVAEDLEITYPHERYDSLARSGVQHDLIYRGCGESSDTLASISMISASVSLSALMTGDIKLPHIEMESPRIYAHWYDDTHANWDIFSTSEEETDESEESMNIILREISVYGSPEIVYTDSQDSLFVRMSMTSAEFDGEFETNAMHRTMADARITDLDFYGRYCGYTLAGDIPDMTLAPHEDSGYMYMTADATLWGELEGDLIPEIPVSISGELSLPEDDGIAIALNNMKAELATIPGDGNLDIRVYDDSVAINGALDIREHAIEPVINWLTSSYAPEMGTMHSDTKVSVHATVEGAYDFETEAMPTINVDIDIPDSSIDNDAFPDKVILGMKANLLMDSQGEIFTDVQKGRVHAYGLDIDAAGELYPVEHDDMEIRIDGNLRASLDSLRAFLPDTLNIVAKGGFSIDLEGTAKMSDLGMYEFSKAGLTGHMHSESMIVQMPEDTIDVAVAGLDLKLLPEYVTSVDDPDTPIRLMGISGTLGSADIKYKEDFIFKGAGLDFTAKNSTDGKKNEVGFLGGKVNAGMVHLEDSEGTSIQIDDTKNRFQMRPDRKNPEIPVLSLSNSNLRITYVTSDNRIILTDSEIKAEAALNTVNRKAQREALLDSLSKIYPEIPRDSLFRHSRAIKGPQAIASWMLEEDFKSSDIRIDINETVKKYFREWDMSGEVDIRTGIIMTPYFPLRNIIRGVAFNFTNDMASIDSLKIMAGDSELRAKGRLTNIRRALLRNGTLKLDMDLRSGSVKADELLKAYSVGSQYEADAMKNAGGELTNAEFFKQVTNDSIQSVETTSSLIVLPGNLDAVIRVRMSGMQYQDLEISRFDSDIAVKERCAQITGATLNSNMGNAYMDAFYSVKSKHDIRSGFCLDLEDVTSERVISLMPEMGEVIPMISSLHGLLFCEIAATAELDTTMSIKMPTVNGIVRLGGNNLTISDDPVYTSIAKKLLFKNKKKGQIKDLMVEGTIKDNCLAVFPFILKLDRYTLGLSGLQNMDMSYKHHISVLRSPLLFRLGLNISGPDYDNMNFKLGKAKYRIKKLPSFTAVIDQTKNDLRYSIYNIFETGVNQTINNSDMQSLIKEYESSIGYINAATLELEELDDNELSEFQEMEAADSMVEDAMTAAMAAIQKALKEYKDE